MTRWEAWIQHTRAGGPDYAWTRLGVYRTRAEAVHRAWREGWSSNARTEVRRVQG